MKKFFTAAALATALLVGGNKPVEVEAQPLALNGNYDFVKVTTGAVCEGIVSYDVDFLALRSGPSTNYPMITRIPPGARVSIVLLMEGTWRDRGYRDYNDNFRKVRYNGRDGFAHRGYINVIPYTSRDNL